MDEIEQNQEDHREDIDSIKANINEVKGSVDQIMRALANLAARQDEERKAP